jgi:hypothetical protein
VFIGRGALDLDGPLPRPTPVASGGLNVYRRPVASNLLRSVGYGLPSSILELEFVDGRGRYEYYDVPLSVYSRLMAAESMGA